MIKEEMQKNPRSSFNGHKIEGLKVYFITLINENLKLIYSYYLFIHGKELLILIYNFTLCKLNLMVNQFQYTCF